MCFDTYTVLNKDGNAFSSDDPILEKITRSLRDNLKHPEKRSALSARRIPRQLRELHNPTEVQLTKNPDGTNTLTIIASDRPGLLAVMAGILLDLDIQILSAKITTLGERVEDTFVIQDANGDAITMGQPAYELTHSIRQRIDHTLAQ